MKLKKIDFLKFLSLYTPYCRFYFFLYSIFLLDSGRGQGKLEKVREKNVYLSKFINNSPYTLEKCKA